MGNGVYIDDGANTITCVSCRFFECEKLGVFVGDLNSSAILTNCIFHDNKRGGVMASEGGHIDLIGDNTQVYDNMKFGIGKY